MNKSKSFKPKARILTLLGEELIKNPVMAIYELVKNSYDADAMRVDVDFDFVDDPDKAGITILDNGIGMTEEILENVWLEPGTDFRKPVDANGERSINLSRIFSRVPMGEKGIGRFAVHKLSRKITLVTRPLLSFNYDKKLDVITNKKLADYEIELTIDWGHFDQHTYLDDLQISWQKKTDTDTFLFKDDHGTQIILEDLKERWTRRMARELKANTLSMTSTNIDRKKFEIFLDFGNEWLAGIANVGDILNDAPFKYTAKVNDEFDFTYEYSFGLKNQEKIGQRNCSVTEESSENIKATIERIYRDKLEADNVDSGAIDRILNAFRSRGSGIGHIEFEIFSYNLDAKSLRDCTNIQNVKKILKENAGIKVYKDDLRVFNYGEPGNDWLGLDLLRINNKNWVSNNQNIGFITLSAADSISLIEKTNREGFIDNQQFKLFKIIIEQMLIPFQVERWKDRQKWLGLNKTAKSSTVDDEFNEIKHFVEVTAFDKQEDKDRLSAKVLSLKTHYDEQKQTLLIPAGVGMTASIALHEIEKLVPRMQDNIKKRPLPLKDLEDNVSELNQYVDGIIAILRKNGNKKIPLSTVVEKAVDNYRYKLKKHGITTHIDIACENREVICDRRLFVTMLMNLIDNAIYWHDTTYQDNKEIFITAVENSKTISLIIADNGPGFRNEDSIVDLVQPFFTRKSDGIGIGLYLVDTIMMTVGKLNLYHNRNELDSYELDEKYNGAIVELVFKKEKR